jgi:hypothetical protein
MNMNELFLTVFDTIVLTLVAGATIMLIKTGIEEIKKWFKEWIKYELIEEELEVIKEK